MPILGIIASARLAVGDYDSIATTTVGSGGTGTITFSSIPATYQHLQIRGIVKSNENSVGATNVEMRFNSDAGGNYTRHYLRGTGSAVDSGASTNQSKMTLATTVQSGTTLANMFGVFIIDILDYTNTNKYTTCRSLAGQDQNGAGTVWFQSGLWMNTAAVTNISLFCDSVNISQYSSFALYGIKG